MEAHTLRDTMSAKRTRAEVEDEFRKKVVELQDYRRFYVVVQRTRVAEETIRVYAADEDEAEELARSVGENWPFVDVAASRAISTPGDSVETLEVKDTGGLTASEIDHLSRHTVGHHDPF